MHKIPLIESIFQTSFRDIILQVRKWQCLECLDDLAELAPNVDTIILFIKEPDLSI